MVKKPDARLTEDARRILARPYARVIYPEDDGSHYGEIVEFPGCFSSGATPAETLSNLEEVAEEWLRIEIEKGHPIPQPMGAIEYSGKLVLRIPKGLHRKAAWAAERDGVSLNQFISTCLAEGVGERQVMPVTTLQMVTINQSSNAGQWRALSSFTNDFIKQFTGEMQRVQNHA